MHSAVNYIYDEATAFRKPTDPAVTADTTSSAISLGRLVNHTGGYAGKLSNEVYTVILVVTDLDTADGDETYSVQLLADDTTAIGEERVIAQTGVHLFHVDRTTIDAADADTAGISLKMFASGTTPSIAYYGWMV